MDRSPFRSVVRRIALAVLLGAGGLAVWWLIRGHSQQRPASQLRRPNQVAAPEVVDVVKSRSTLAGTAACTECHRDLVDRHQRSGHARTFTRTNEIALTKSICGSQFESDANYGTFTYRCDGDGLIAVSERLQSQFHLTFALGSGDRAATFLSLARDPQDKLVGVEHRATWITSHSGLQITPGQRNAVPQTNIEFFGRLFDEPRTKQCISCHVTAFSITQDARLVDVIAGVQCEECHGPGRDHVDAMQRERSANGSLSIGRPESAEAEIRLCGRCHRVPEDISPERLAAYPKALHRFQPIGLLRSRCYLESDGRLRCSTCHDPHGSVSERSPVEWESSCRSCHASPTGSTCAEHHTADCIRCHMQRTELIPGINYHDHWIRRRPVNSEDDRSADDLGVASE